MKRILLACFTLAAIVVFFQNCSVPNSGGMSSTETLDSNSEADVGGALKVISMADKIYINDRVQLLTSGGVEPYQYSIADGDGKVDQSRGIYTAGNSAGSAIIQVMDSHSNIAKVRVKVLSAGSAERIAIHMSKKSEINGYYYSNIRSATTSAPASDYKYVGKLFNTFTMADSPRTIFMCKKIISTTVHDYFLSADSGCEGKAEPNPIYLGLLEAKPTDTINNPVFRCKRSPGKPMRLTTLNKNRDCGDGSGYKFERILGYTQ